MKTRNIAFDLLKLFAIFLVLWGHCIQHMKVTNTEEPIFLFIYSFHMPLFMMISGYFCISSLSMRLWPFLKKKFIQLLLPCLTWYVLAYVLPKLALLLVHKEGGAFSVNSLYVLLHNFWFLKSVFVCYVLAYLGFKGKWLGILLSILVSQIIPLFSVGFLYPSFLVGILLSEKSLLDDNRKIHVIMISSLMLWIALLFKMKWIEYNIPIDVLLISPNLVTGRLLRVITGLSGALFWMSLFTELFKGINNNKIISLSTFGKYTLGIYILQTYILEEGLCKIISLDKYPLFVSDFLIASCLALSAMFVCINIIKTTDRNKLATLLLWGYNRR